MAFKIIETIDKEGRSRRFSAIPGELNDIDYWEFHYITLNTNEPPQDQTIYGGQVDNSGKTESEGGKYPDPHDGWPIGTIFFDSGSQVLYMTSSISNVIIDTEPPKFIGENVQYLVFDINRTCEFTIESDTLIDVCQLIISCGNEVLYSCTRKNGIIDNNYITNISYNKTGSKYTLSFVLDKEYSAETLTLNQLRIEVWDIAGNKAEYRTTKTWHNLKEDPSTLKPLIIEFVEVMPEDKIISKNVEGKVLVKVTNPNDSLWPIPPTINLCEDSIGIIDVNSIRYYDEDGNDIELSGSPNKVVTYFYITNINEKGYIHVEAWIDVDNNDIKEYVKNQTYADASLGPFIFADEGRKYKFNTYTPTYLTDDLYKRFVKFTQDFLNTSQTSMSTGNYISTLEKIARINNFMDPFRVEPPLLQQYAEEFNIEVNPNLNEYMYYLNHQQGLTKDK